ncbi:hypothetical protein PFAG_03971 [Plasmodium falciparum Santa Lucia]|uniref:Uncharacterized protein n=2 Tax=Plasmodium falciparum TaxID=5833 RepID=W4J312_PLAFP|nr:hypothetical protein PFUGPA_02046 [Plasmodium falciparum Palo Alto/Uganda]EUT82596.1 hypothetical protein PFAG_03971 [Plasmodium falciparum Santa Lucia]
MYIIKILLYIFLNNKILSKFSKITYFIGFIFLNILNNNNFSYMTLIHIILIKSYTLTIKRQILYY